jgi:tetratricopeptide (TPR) repeat protein
MDNIELTQPEIRYRETPLLLRNVGGKFSDVSARAGAPFLTAMAGRGAAFGDLNNDGAVDVVVAWGGLGKASERRAALARFSELTKKQKDDAESQRKAGAWIDEARALMQAGDLENAAARLELAREAKPGDATLLFRLAGLNFDLQRYDAAREYVQAAISISPATWLYHYLLGLVERSANHLSDARASLETAAKLQSTEAPVFNTLGEVLLEQGERQAAIEAFEKAIKLAPGDASFQRNLESARTKR